MLQRTLAIVKPDAFPQNVGAILTMATEAGLVPVRMKMEEYLDETWERFYGEHKERHFFKALVEFMESGPVLVMVLEGDYAITHWRELMGPTDSRKARDTLRGATETVRGRFGAPGHFLTTKSTGRVVGEVGEYPMWQNAVHGSDSIEAAVREIEFFFGLRT